MITFNKKTILIIAIVLVVIALITLNVFLFLNWQTKQKEAQRQVKVAQDIQTVQNLVSEQKFNLLQPENLQKQGLEPEALDLAVKLQISVGAPDVKLEQNITGLLADYNMYSGEADTRATELLNLRPTIVKDLGTMLNKNTVSDHFRAYQALIIIGQSDLVSRQEIIPILTKGMADPNKTVAIKNASVLLGWGEKSAIPVMISGVDEKYSQMLIPVEPALSIPLYSKLILSQYTGQKFGSDQAQWQAWWAANQNRIKWDNYNSEYIPL